MEDRDDKAWFEKKRIGWGYKPRRWQGWLVPALLIVIVVVVVDQLV